MLSFFIFGKSGVKTFFYFSDNTVQFFQKLNEDFSYIQENAGSLLLSGLSSLLFPSNKSTTKTNDKNTAPVTAGQPSIALGISDYLSMAKGMIPIAWDLAQPFIMTLGIKKAKKWFSNLLFKKKK